jgi:hypothetical protein
VHNSSNSSSSNRWDHSATLRWAAFAPRCLPLPASSCTRCAASAFLWNPLPAHEVPQGPAFVPAQVQPLVLSWHHGLVSTIEGANAAFGPAARLAKRWVGSLAAPATCCSASCFRAPVAHECLAAWRPPGQLQLQAAGQGVGGGSLMARPGPLSPQVGAHLMSSQLADEAVELLVAAAFGSASLEGPPASRLAGEPVGPPLELSWAEHCLAQPVRARSLPRPTTASPVAVLFAWLRAAGAAAACWWLAPAAACRLGPSADGRAACLPACICPRRLPALPAAAGAAPLAAAPAAHRPGAGDDCGAARKGAADVRAAQAGGRRRACHVPGHSQGPFVSAVVGGALLPGVAVGASAGACCMPGCLQAAAGGG